MNKKSGNVDYEALKVSLTAALEPLKHLRLEPSRVKPGQHIGSGGFGDVFHATLKSRVSMFKADKAPIVVKQLRATGDKEQRLRVVVALARELVVWSRFKHPNVLPLSGFYYDDVNFTYACAVTEFQENGNILDYLIRVGPDVEILFKVLLDSANGIAYLHSLDPSVCHGDIKPENTLVNRSGRAMICDFGLSKTEGGPSGLTTTAQPFTARYASPEVLSDPSVRSKPSDVWSWGCLFYQLITRNLPYRNLDSLGAIHTAATNGETPSVVNAINCPPAIKDILRSCWEFKPESRPTMKKCARMVFELHRDYPPVSEYFSGAGVVGCPIDLKHPLGASLGPFDIAYNPDIPRKIDVTSISLLKFAKEDIYVVGFAFAANGKFVTIGEERIFRRYNNSTALVLEKTFPFDWDSRPVRICCSSDAETIAVTLENGDILASDFTRKYKINPVARRQSDLILEMCFADSDQLLLVRRADSSLDALPLDQRKSPYKLSDQAGAMDVSPRHPVVIVGDEERTVTRLLDLRTGAILQEFPSAWRAGFNPDGLSFVLQRDGNDQPSIWEFQSSVGTEPAYALSPNGPSGRFVEIGTVECPQSVGNIKTSVASDASLACSTFFDDIDAPSRGLHVWDLKTRKTMLTMVFTLDDFRRQTLLIHSRIENGSTASKGYIDLMYDSSLVYWTGLSGEGCYGYRIEYAATTHDPVPIA